MGVTAADRAKVQRAEALLADPVLAEAFAQVRETALADLAVVDATNTAEILRLQAIANCLGDVRDALFSVLIDGGRLNGGDPE